MPVYHVRLLRKAAKTATLVRINRAESLAQVKIDGLPLSMVTNWTAKSRRLKSLKIDIEISLYRKYDAATCFEF